MFLRNYQRQAISSIPSKGRCLIKMWCGTGKTRTFWVPILEWKHPLNIIVFPWLNLIEQFERDYIKDKEWEPHMKGIEYKVVSSKGTTRPSDIANFVAQDGQKVILVTYDSFHLVQHLKADVMVFDEAHHTVRDEVRPVIYDLDKPLADKMIFVTATPHQEKNKINMIDLPSDQGRRLVHSVGGLPGTTKSTWIENDLHTSTKHCGPLITNYNYFRAVNDGYANFISLVPLVIRKNDPNKTKSIMIQLLKEADASGHRRIMTFHALAQSEQEGRTNVQQVVRELITILSELEAEGYMIPKWTVRGITGSTPDEERKAIMKEFEACPDNELYILASCKTLGEGIDTKKANKVVFWDPRTSVVDVTQIMGRAGRKQEDGMSEAHFVIETENGIDDLKRLAEHEGEVDEELREMIGEEFSPVLRVVSWLRQEDPVLAELCLMYPNSYSVREHRINLERQGYGMDEEPRRVEEIFDGAETLEEASEKTGKTIEVFGSNIDEAVRTYGEGDETVRFVEDEDGGLYEVHAGGEEGLEPPRPPRRGRMFKPPVVDFDVKWNALFDDLGRVVLDCDVVSAEERKKQWAREYVEFKKQNGRKPKETIKEGREKERELACTMTDYRKALKGRAGKVYVSVNNILDEGLQTKEWRKTDQTTGGTAEEKAQKNAYEYVEFYRENGYFPKKTEKPGREKESKLAEWKDRYRRVLQGKVKGQSYDSVDNIMDEGLGTTAWRQHDKGTLQEEAEKNAHEYVEFYKKIGDVPKKSQQPGREKESKLDQWIKNYQRALNGKAGKEYASVNKILDEGLGTTEWRQEDQEIKGTREEEAQKNAHKYVNFYKSNGREPQNTRQKGREEECRLAEWMERYRKALKGKGGNEYNSVNEILDEGLGTKDWRERKVKMAPKKRKEASKPTPEERLESLTEEERNALALKHLKTSTASKGGEYCAPNPEAKTEINAILAANVPDRGQVVILDHTDFGTATALGVHQSRLIIPQRDYDLAMEMREHHVYGSCVQYMDLLDLTPKPNSIGLLYADLMGSRKELLPILQKFKDAMMPGGIVATSVSCRDGDEASWTNQFASLMLSDVLQHFPGASVLTEKGGPLVYGSGVRMATLVICVR